MLCQWGACSDFGRRNLCLCCPDAISLPRHSDAPQDVRLSSCRRLGIPSACIVWCITVRRTRNDAPSNDHPYTCTYILDEQELFSMTQCRWLFNNEQQLALRYVPFNIEALIDIAVRSASARRCVSFKKISEGIANRVFALKFDNDVDYILKIPFSVAGPKHLCTASEVATLDYLDTELEFPVPLVRAWSSHAEETPVGAEYILYERLPGTSLSDFDKNDFYVTDDPYIRILPFFRRFEHQMTVRGFSQIGSLYYKEDLPQELRDWPLYSSGTDSGRFRIGPTVDREFWRAGRSTLDIDRGPWPDDRAYMAALGACARASVEAGLDADPDGAYRHLISVYDELVPHMAPLRSSCTLWHPDLHAGNIIVDGDIDVEDADADSFQLSGIIDWQGATVLPYYLQYTVPPAYEFTPSDEPLVQYAADGTPNLPDDYDNVCDEDKAAAQYALRRAWRALGHKIVIQAQDARLANDLYGTTTGANVLRLTCDPVTTVTQGGYSLAPLARSIATVQSIWTAIVGADESGSPRVRFPSAFSDEDTRRMEQEEARLERILRMCNDVLTRLDMQWEHEGLVPAEKYDEAKKVMEDARQAALAAAPSEEERQRIAEDWPYQDGKPVLSADRCW
ncbi:kinase-like domain-containing protein [Schizophyllum amplum]|uniref:Kinase-like domain-containing protein n=1 Tax=Schizophyllum amplum TaxID=97359 RepID=A0A550C7J6_9AGAR|nr:kinase-like domain-containing protein [Auriculariopsis ampla]